MGDRIFGTETEFGLYKIGRSPENGYSWDIFKRYLLYEDIQSLTADAFIKIFSQPFNRLVFYNGGMFYFDMVTYSEHDHVLLGGTPEYCTPECRSVRDLIAHEKAGELIVYRIFKRALADKAISLVKFGRGKSESEDKEVISGHHENYSLLYSLGSVTDLFFKQSSYGLSKLATFLASRVIFHGSGWPVRSKESPFEISSRANFTERIISLATTAQRPMIIGADVVEGNMGHRIDSTKGMTRFPIIVGDHLMSEAATFLTFGTTSIVLDMITEKFLDDCPILADPVTALHVFSGNPTLDTEMALVDNNNPLRKSRVSVLELNNYFCSKAEEFVSSRDSSDEEKEIVRYWRDVLTRLSDNIDNLFGELDWVTVLTLIKSYLRRHKLGFSSLSEDKYIRIPSNGSMIEASVVKSCQAICLRYHYITSDGIYNRLCREGKIKRIITDRDIIKAVYEAPQNTRARIRSDFVRFIADKGVPLSYFDGNSWNSLEFKISQESDKKIQIDISNPFDSHSEMWEDFKRTLIRS